MNKDNWIVFKDMSYRPFQLTRSCVDTINAECVKNISLEECIDVCKNDKNKFCDAGYYIDLKNKNNLKSLCFPLNTDYYPDLSHYIDIRPKSEFPYSNQYNVNTFVNTNKFPFPPKDTNTVWFDDDFLVKNVETGKFLETVDDESDIVMFADNPKDTLIQLIPKTFYELKTVVKYEDEECTLAIPKTTLVLSQKPFGVSKGLSSFVSWVGVSYFGLTQLPLLTFESTENKKKGEPMCYGDVFYIKMYNNNYIGLNENNSLTLYNKDINVLKENKFPSIKFTFIPKFNLYTCDNGVCKEVNIAECEHEGTVRLYKGNPTYRSNVCYGVCNNTLAQTVQEVKTTTNLFGNKHYHIIILLFSIFIHILFVYAYFKKRR